MGGVDLQGHAMDREELPGTTAPRLQVGANRAVKKGTSALSGSLRYCSSVEP